jgi:drug/metabolite transporter (DMT)-like permease
MMGTTLAIAGVIQTPFALLQVPSRTPSAGALASTVVLGLVCTALAFVLMALLVFEAGPSRSTVVTYINPLVAVLVAAVFLDERLSTGGAVGLVLILVGSWQATRAERPAAPSGVAAPRPRV